MFDKIEKDVWVLIVLFVVTFIGYLILHLRHSLLRAIRDVS